MEKLDITPEETEEAIEEQVDPNAPRPLSDEEVLAIAKEDLQTAKQSKIEINKKIKDSKDLYDGKPLGNETSGRSSFVSKEAQKAVNWWIPNAMKPFMSSNNIVDFAPRTADDIQKAKSQNTLLNYQFNNGFEKYQFLYTSLQCFSSEGTVVARTGWIHEDEQEVIPFEGFTQEQVEELRAQGAEIDIEEEAWVIIDAMEARYLGEKRVILKGTATITKTTVSRPDAEVLKIEDFFIIGETIEDSEACIQRIDTTRSKLLKQDKSRNPNGIYENVKDIVANGTDAKDAGLAQDRQDDLEEHGTIEESQKAKDDITIYEYYGLIDRDGDGIAEPVVVVWSGSTILRISENPFPDNLPPFIGAPFMPIAFNFFGNSLPHFLEDVTKIKTAITRTAIDLMANSTNGMKHVQAGTIDALNIRRLREAKIGTVVEWIDINGYKPEVKSDIPASLMPMLEHFTAEGENESGITRYNQGLDAKSLNKTATGITAIMNQSQMRTWETVTRFAEQFMKPLFRKWIAYNQEFLDMDVAVRVATDKYEAVSKDDIGGEYDLTVNVAIAGQEEMKSQKMVGLLQMVTPFVEKGVIPPNHMTKVVAELEELAGFKDLADELNQLADAKAEAKTEAVQGFMSLPEDVQIQAMQMIAQQQGNQQGIPNQGQPQ